MIIASRSLSKFETVPLLQYCLHATKLGVLTSESHPKYFSQTNTRCTRDVFYVCRVVDLMKTAKVNAYIMYIFGKIELLSVHAT